jgi:rod shape determining protein RodA
MMSKVHWPLLALTLALAAYGVVMVASATQGFTYGDALVRRHVIGIVIGAVLLAFAWAVDYKVWQHWTGPLLILVGVLLVAVLLPVFGATSRGATSWLEVGGVRLFQPSEPVKLLLIVIMAAAVARFEGAIAAPRDAMTVVGYLIVPLALILVQPDLGTAAVFVAITLGMLTIGGMKGKYFVVALVVGVVLAAIVLQTPLLQDYQVNRLLVFIDPSADTQSAGYNLAQSKIAVGSGGLTGKGLGSGTQSNLNFLPERHTDFIFSVLGEELGFAGASFLILLYLGFLMSALAIAASSKDLYGALVCTGLAGMWLFQVLVNIGMTVGIMPITGIPLPFMSFGSSSMVTNLAGVGMLQSVYARRYGA